MKTLPFTLLAILLAAGTAAALEKEKRPDVSSYPFYTAQKRGSVPQFVPGLNAVLALSDAQKEQIVAARDEILGEEAVKAAGRLSKADPNVTAEQREAARGTIQRAAEQLREKVSAILTPEQATLIQIINTAHAAAVDTTRVTYEERFGRIKDNEAERRQLHDEMSANTRQLFLEKLATALTADQKESMARAAEEENRRLAKPRQ